MAIDAGGSVLLEGLNDAQRVAVTSEAAPLCILAGAGSGKTRVLTRRIAHRCATGSADPRHVLALTFTRKAAGELASRLRTLGLRGHVAAGTFHAIAYGQLRQHWADHNQRPPALLERKGRILGRLLPRSPGRPVTTLDAAAEIEWAKARLVPPDRYAVEGARAGRRPPLAFDAMGHVYQRYEEEKSRARLVDFDDLLLLCARAIAADSEFGAAQRWQFRHLFVDEFQDVNPLQFRLLEAWRGDSTDLCVVGDPNQAIYAWNGADARYLSHFSDHFVGSETVSLDHNYRSSPQILSVANTLLRAGGAAGMRLRATRPDGPLPSVHDYDSDRHEARAIARAVRDRNRPGVPWSHQAVLVRTNAQGVLFEEAFRAARIPFRIRGRAAFLDLPEVKDALRTLATGSDFAGALAELETSITGFDEPADDQPAEPGPSDAELARVRNLEALLRLADEYLVAEPVPTGTGFATWLAATVRSEDADATGDAVDIATFHAAKGLEWPIVHVAGLEAGLVPIGHAKTADAQAEERRLLYVAVTRAERELRLSWTEQRTFGARVSARSPSPYLDEIEQLLEALASGNSPADWRANLQRERQRLRSSRTGRSATASSSSAIEPVDQEVFDALRQWRASAARAAAVSAFVIFHDTTLREIARSRPCTRDALLAVPGVGPVKAGRFGDAVLEVVARHAREANG